MVFHIEKELTHVVTNEIQKKKNNTPNNKKTKQKKKKKETREEKKDGKVWKGKMGEGKKVKEEANSRKATLEDVVKKVKIKYGGEINILHLGFFRSEWWWF